MKKTKNDLSFNEAKLDLEAMTVTAKVAVGRLIDSISSRIGELRDHPSSYLVADWLNDDARWLTICSETLATLEGAKNDREIITIIR